MRFRKGTSTAQVLRAGRRGEETAAHPLSEVISCPMTICRKLWIIQRCFPYLRKQRCAVYEKAFRSIYNRPIALELLHSRASSQPGNDGPMDAGAGSEL